MTPGELILAQRDRQLWTQRELAERCGVPQSRLSQYERGVAQPTWTVLRRILGAMGMQPTVSAEECDIALHEDTAELRRSRREESTWSLRGARDPVDLDALLDAPKALGEQELRCLEPAITLLGSTSFALTGALARRLSGEMCTVPCVEIDVFEGPLRFPAGLADRMATAQMELWCPETGHYRSYVTGEALADIIARTGGELTFRSRRTTTRVEVTLRRCPMPTHYIFQRGEFAVPLLVPAWSADDDEAPESYST